ncbi:hypothetical protein IT409_02385 [Candidatus Falkowbacteria bacterium]|nr:hypothetical protein [Candidatus Falkowbacteria bacterium]
MASQKLRIPSNSELHMFHSLGAIPASSAYLDVGDEAVITRINSVRAKAPDSQGKITLNRSKTIAIRNEQINAFFAHGTRASRYSIGQDKEGLPIITTK